MTLLISRWLKYHPKWSPLTRLPKFVSIKVQIQETVHCSVWSLVRHYLISNSILAFKSSIFIFTKVRIQMDFSKIPFTFCSLPSSWPIKELTEVLKSAKDFEELAYYWTAWHDEMSKQVPTSEYKRFIDLQNIMAKANSKFYRQPELIYSFSELLSFSKCKY